MKKLQTPLRQVPIPAIYRRDVEFKSGLAFGDTLKRLDLLARFMLLNGVFCIEDPVKLSETIETVAKDACGLHDIQKSAASLIAVVARAGLNEDQRKALRELDDLVGHTGNSWGEAGYLLGLAVGMRLNPGALEGGAR